MVLHKRRTLHLAEKGAESRALLNATAALPGAGGQDEARLLGIVDRGDRVRPIVIPNRKKKALRPKY
jgi:hypothetical protein